MKVREWKSMTLAEQTAWYGQARHGELGYGQQAALCDQQGHTPLVLWALVGRLLCGSCGRTLPAPEADGLASALRTAAA